MKTEELNYLDIHKDQDVSGRWVIAYSQATNEFHTFGIPYQPGVNPPELYDQMAVWLKEQTPSFINETAIAVLYDCTFKDITEDYDFVPDATYTSAEFLFRPKGEVPSLDYVSEHFREFQAFCQEKGYIEPLMTPEVYERIPYYIDGRTPKDRQMPYNTTAYFDTPELDYQYFLDIFSVDAQPLGKCALVQEVIPKLTLENRTQPIYLKNDYSAHATGMLIDYHFLVEWATEHGPYSPDDWAKNIMGEEVTETFIATHYAEWQQFLTRHQLPDLEPSLRSLNYHALLSHFQSTPLRCETAQELHQLLVSHPSVIERLDKSSPLLLQMETWCPIKQFKDSDWELIKTHIPDALWDNAAFQADLLLNDPKCITQIGDRLCPENLILLTAEQYPLLSESMKTLPQLVPLSLQCVWRDPTMIQQLPNAVLTAEHLRAAATQDLSAVLRMPAWLYHEAKFTDAEFCYLLKSQTLTDRQIGEVIRRLPDCLHTPEVCQTLKQLADKYNIAYQPDMDYAQQVKRQRGR